MRKRFASDTVRWPLVLATRLGIVLLASLFIACANQPTGGLTPAYSATIDTQMLLAGEPIVGPTGDTTATADAADILAVDDDMRQFLGAYVNPRDSRFVRLEQLLRAIISDGSFGLVYEERTLTAADTFAARAGNCLSFTSMFIAMAREAGLNVSYQEVSIPPDWTMQGDTYVLSRHVNVKVNVSPGIEHVVDFNIDDFKTTYKRREISDERAYAHFFSNIGVEKMQAGDYSGALLMLRTALEFDRAFAPGWSNLAALYNRVGAIDYAEAAYQEALRLQPDELLVMSNLARLYETQGDKDKAAYYQQRAQYHRNLNPYYRYELARQAFLERDYDAAIDHLEYAVDKKQWEDNFYFLMGLSYLQLGDERQARRWLEKAESVAEGDALKRNYQSKMDLLLSSQPRGQKADD